MSDGCRPCTSELKLENLTTHLILVSVSVKVVGEEEGWVGKVVAVSYHGAIASHVCVCVGEIKGWGWR